MKALLNYLYLRLLHWIKYFIASWYLYEAVFKVSHTVFTRTADGLIGLIIFYFFFLEREELKREQEFVRQILQKQLDDLQSRQGDEDDED